MNPATRNFIGISLLLSSLLPNSADAVTLENGQTCPAGTRLVTFEDAWNNSSAYCGFLGTWSIARLSGGGSMDGPGYGCGVRLSDPRSLGQALCQPVPQGPSLTSVILGAGWRTSGQLASMSENDKRNTVIVGLSLASKESVATLQAKSDSQLIGYVEIYIWLLESHSRTAAELAQMSLDDQRNTTIVALHLRTAEPIPVLAALGNLSLTAMARSLPKIIYQIGQTCPAGTVLVGFGEAKDNSSTYCSMLGAWDIVRLSGNGSMDGPGYGCGVRSTDSRSLGGALCKSATKFSSLSALILEAGWRTSSQLAAMTEVEKRDLVNSTMSLASTESIAALKALSNDGLVGKAEIYLWLLGSQIRTAGQLALMSLDDQRNTAVVALNVGTGEDITVLSALDNHSLIEMARFYSANPSGFWMAENIALLGDRPLRHLCIPGSHDAGMSEFNDHTAFATAANTQTQKVGILQQLQKGVRYFDIRPVISGGNFYTGHYGEIEIGHEIPLIGFVSIGTSFQGANGQSIASIINDVNTFTAFGQPGQPGELIVIYLSHDLNTDVGNSSYRSFVQSEWDNLLSQLQGIHFLYEETNPSVDLTQIPLGNFTRNGSAVVVIVDASPAIDLRSRAGRGFFRKSNFPVYDSYSDTNSLNGMKNDQLAKLQQQRPNPDSSYFLLSWTLTQQGVWDVTFGPSILTLAEGANPAIYSALLPACTQQTYPNVLFIDGVDSSNITALAMAVNIKAIGHM